MTRLDLRTTIVACLTLAIGLMSAEGAEDPAAAPPSVSPGLRYATDAYPGFDLETGNRRPERKTPRWFSWVTGPKRDNAIDQMAYCQELVAEEDYDKACKHLDALVREWPTAPEAPKAQLQLAELRLNKLLDCAEAFADYRYMLDFYALQCDYDKVVDTLYKIANMMKEEGKSVMFVRFANTVEVRRAYEACVLRAPGASWAPKAMLTIGTLREDEDMPGEAIKVYENLRNIHPGTEEARAALVREAEVRMRLLREHRYNRDRVLDTINFLKIAVRNCDRDDAERLTALLTEASLTIEDEAYQAAKFYDSKTRTARNAINAYERFLAEYPGSVHADEVRERIEALKGQRK